MDENTNSLRLSGTVHELPVFGHEVFGEAFYHTTIAVPRLSVVADLLPATASERLLPHEELVPGQPICIEGQLRSYNKVIAGQGRLLITAFAQKIPAPSDDENPNQISLFGTLCKQPGYRTTPFGREICDLMLA
ncbi:MAG: single-stranded DNA-binding protein, partial [Eubacteriales bacterium]|nr:single-stranded DNA-binding protein [Eubacteriales bacterium]